MLLSVFAIQVLKKQHFMSMLCVKHRDGSHNQYNMHVFDSS